MATNVAPLTRDELMAQAQARGVGRSQATVVEQSRAIAEVQGALIVADRRPRDRQRALAEAMESCRTQEVAQYAFFKFPRGGQSVSGPSIHLARELARCWGNVIYAVVELDRDDDRAVSEMMAYAWDLETNTRNQSQFLVPHKRDKRGGAEILTDMRDIYENNANMGARRLRECIFAILPPYLTKAAEDQCYKTLQQGSDDQPLPVRINQAIEAFAAISIDKKRIEARMGPVSRFTEVDLANLRIAFGSIKRGEVQAADEFPALDSLTGDMIQTSAEESKRAAEPKQQPLGKALNDEIPAFDNPAPQSKSEPIYEPEGRADEDMGEGFTSDTQAEAAAQTIAEIDGPPEAFDDRPAWWSKVEWIRLDIAAAKTKQYLKDVDFEFSKIRAGLPDDVIEEIEGLLAARRTELTRTAVPATEAQ